MKQRVDTLLVERGLVPTRTKAQALIMAGAVFIGTEKVTKAGEMVAQDAAIEVRESSPYVSRGADKLSGAAADFGLDFTGKVIADVGASTGGFTDYALQHGATRVYAIDVGTNQLAWRLRQDPRVISMEQTHIKDVESLPEPIDLWVVDTSFISLRKVLPEIRRIARFSTENQQEAVLARSDIQVVCLFKPQFEAGRELVSKTRGVITDRATHEQLLQEFRLWCAENDFKILSETVSPIVGDKGNKEFFFYIEIA